MAGIDDRAAEVLTTLLERLAEQGDTIISAIDKLIEIERSGVLDQLILLLETFTTLSKLPEELIDPVIMEVARKNMELLLTLSLSIDEETIKFVDKALQAFKDARSFEPAGVTSSLKALRDPDIQKSLGFLLSLAKNLGKRL